jgi:flagellar biosynthesis protein FlhA
MAALGLTPGLPFLPFAMLASVMAFVGFAIPRRIARSRAEEAALEKAKDEPRRAPRSASSSSRSRSSWCSARN